MPNELNWSDIAYFSKGLLSVDSSSGLLISTTKYLTVTQFVKAVLDSASTAEMTLNALKLPADRAINFPTANERPPIYNEENKNYTKIVNYVFTDNQILSKEEVEK